MVTATRYTRDQLFAQSRVYATARRPGVAADLDGAGTKNLFTVSGTVSVEYMFGVCTTVIGAGLCVPGIRFTPASGSGIVSLCLAAASIANSAAGSIFVWDGLLGGQLAAGAVLGLKAANVGTPWVGPIVLPAGTINLTGVVDALSGVIDWYVVYLPQVAGATIVAA